MNSVLRVAACGLLAAAPSPATAGESVGGTPTGAPGLARLESAFQEVIARVTPSVVGIRAQRVVALGATTADAGRAGDADIGSQLVFVNGSGTVIHIDGAILTNEHVVQSATEITVIFHDGIQLPATVAASDPRSDLAVLRTTRNDLPPARLCDWPRVARGQWAVSLGNPYGLGIDGRLSASVGVVSNLGRRLPGLGEQDDRLYQDMIQITASISPGNSGCPLFNLNGEMVGVVTAMHTRAIGDQGVGFAIPLDPQRRTSIDALLAGERVEYGYIGLSVRDARPGDTSRHATGVQGARVDAVEPRGPADAAGVLVGDVITHFNHASVSDAGDLVARVGRARPGQVVEIKLDRAATTTTARVTVERRELTRVTWMRGDALVWCGLRLANVNPGTAQTTAATPQRDARGGIVVVGVAPGTPTAKDGWRVGDIIDAVDEHPVEDLRALEARLSGVRRAVRLTLRSGQTRSVALP
ncbi:MAG: trypsin-like peptidase domain-containing protein [Phycisphaerae bacterium]